MSTLLENSSYSEIESGCIFAEKFFSQEKMKKNGAVISGTTATYPQLENRVCKTVFAVLKKPVSTNRVVTIGGIYSIIIAAGSSYGYSSAAGGMTMISFSVANYSDFAYVGVFTYVMGAADVKIYAAQALNNVPTEMNVSAKMRLYDNAGQILHDISGNNRQGTLIGSPVKMATKGLIFNGTNKILFPAVTNMPLGTIYICFKPAISFLGAEETRNILFVIDDGLPNPVISLGTYSGAIANEVLVFGYGASGNGNYIKDYIRKETPHVFCAKFGDQSNTYDIWLDGFKRTVYNYGSALPAITMTGVPTVGYQSLRPYSGIIYDFILSSVRHTDAQVRDISRRMLESVNEVL